MEPRHASLGDLPMESWMSGTPPDLWDVPLHQLAIPGSHNAITYCLDRDRRSPIDVTQPDLLKKLDRYMKPLVRHFLYKWAVTQDNCVWQQLNCGVRYCDLRIGRKPGDDSGDLYFYHGLYTTLTVETVLAEICSWLDAHPKEVVVLSFSHFLDVSDQLHMQLLCKIRNIFASKITPRMKTPTLRKLWSLGHQVIVSYEHAAMAASHADLWPSIPYWWANKCKVEALIDDFELRKTRGRPGRFFVTGINLTVDLKYICTHLNQRLKDMATSAEPALLAWLERQSPGDRASSINIVAGDFAADGRFTRTVVALNDKLLHFTQPSNV
ncbi:PI-PLC X domain-containing protein 1 [Corythoichthys intestinalis]|uniref:PI-PLC X domain-containing protein 1 n=1 Tax=Corythoichthys intestinalis TaxID=161448 RepID=UPI0025A61210|nr:PI-PLC X domain-containing protein 1 [Corythoichthys intestinalis]XP_057696455.1 PI-PLC X domain-containing protein 1 [Corythoichthys intestinalis]XP_061790365.1 PI-PLC X domain-containing protein 1-like [Nerophis lumbriciformis]